MSKRIIAKFSLFVISITCSSAFFACSNVSSGTAWDPAAPNFSPPMVNGRIESNDVTESSGIAASKCQTDVYWTHNDSGDEAFVYAINSSGKDLGTWKLTGVVNIDWEDIASYRDISGKCFLYIGEIGDNKARRTHHAILRVAEPLVTTDTSASARLEPLAVPGTETLPFRYPDVNQDAETLMVHPTTGDIYVLTKRVNGPAGVYRLKPDFGRTFSVDAERIADLSVPAVPNGFVTGGDIAPDGRSLIICDYSQAYEYALSDPQSDFESIWKLEPEVVALGKRAGGESVAYSADGSSVFATSEGKNPPVIEIKRRNR